MKKASDKFQRLTELSKLGKGTLLQGRVEKFHTDLKAFSEGLESYIALKALAKAISSRLDDIKEVLHDATENTGQQSVDGNKVYRTKRVATMPDEDKLRALLETRKIELNQAFDTVQVLKLSGSKLQYLVDTGKLRAEDIEPLHKVTWAIDVEPSEELKETLDLLLQVPPKGKGERKGKV